MSRLGSKPVDIPEGIKIKVESNILSVEGPKGKLTQRIRPELGIEKKDSQILIKRSSDDKFYKALHGLTRSLILNMIQGVSEGFQKVLEIIGVGYTAKIQDGKLVLQLGFSHPIEYTPPEGIQLQAERKKNFRIIVSGMDKQEVGQVARLIRDFRPPDSYKGKGIRFEGEEIKLKEGKTGATAASGA